MPHTLMFVASCLAVGLGCSMGCDHRPPSTTNQTTTATSNTQAAPHPLASELAEVNAHFTYHGEPIHPKLIHAFIGRLSDAGPITITVDLANAFGSDAYWQDDVTKRPPSWIGYNPTKNQGFDASFDYQWIGTLTNGTHIVWCSDWGGGSGKFGTLLWLEAKTDWGMNGDGTLRPRLLLTVVRDAVLGDRATKNVRVDGNTVWVKPSGRYAADGSLNIDANNVLLFEDQPEFACPWIEPSIGDQE